MPRAHRVFGYARVSSEEQAKGSSLRDQQRAIEAHAKSLGQAVTQFFVESESAVHEKFERREQIQQLMRTIRASDLVLCDKVDRWSRDPEFSYRSVREILETGASIYFIDERIDPRTPDGDSALNFRILFAREEHKRIKTRMVGTRRRLRDQGYYVEGLPPYGYKRPYPKGYKGAEKNVLAIDEDAASHVRRAFVMCAAGRSIDQIVVALGLSRDVVARLVHNRTYVGEIQSTTGTWIRAKHEPVVDAALFTRAQDALRARRLGGPRPPSAPAETSTWILRDVARCGRCDARMGAAYAGPKDARRYYYRCVKGCTPYVAVRVIEFAAEPMILERLTELRDELGREPPRVPVRRTAGADVEKRIRLERKRARYLEMYADGIMERDKMVADVARVDADLLRLSAAAPAPSPLADVDRRRSALREVATLERAWRRAEPRQRRAIVNELATKVLIAADDAPKVTWRTAEELAVAVE